MTNTYDKNEMKRKVRKLKIVECKIRFNRDTVPEDPRIRIVWDDMFNLSSDRSCKGRYTLDVLVALSKEGYKNVINEFFFKVYEQYYQENALSRTLVRNTNTLEQLGLPYDADDSTIKRRFRELAKEYHPDHGGDQEKFIWLMELYKQLIG